MAYICEGAVVRYKNSMVSGIVMAIDKNTQIVVIRGLKNTWTEKMCELEVISYEEVE